MSLPGVAPRQQQQQQQQQGNADSRQQLSAVYIQRNARNVRNATNAADATTASIVAVWPLRQLRFLRTSLAFAVCVACVALDGIHALVELWWSVGWSVGLWVADNRWASSDAERTGRTTDADTSAAAKRHIPTKTVPALQIPLRLPVPLCVSLLVCLTVCLSPRASPCVLLTLQRTLFKRQASHFCALFADTTSHLSSSVFSAAKRSKQNKTFWNNRMTLNEISGPLLLR